MCISRFDVTRLVVYLNSDPELGENARHLSTRNTVFTNLGQRAFLRPHYFKAHINGTHEYSFNQQSGLFLSYVPFAAA
jgi:hypothetical protein